MRLKSFLFLFLFVFMGTPVYPVTQMQSDSGSGPLGKPSVTFKEWQIGRSQKSSDSSNTAPNSFITSTETTCRFIASVGYNGNQGDSVSPIDPSTVSWSVMDADPSSLSLDTASVSTNWSGKHPSKLDPGTSFNVVGTINVPTFSRNTSCSHSDDDRLLRVPRHRGGTKLGFSLKFMASTEDGQSVETTLALKADQIDRVRQEYVDYNKPIPVRSDSRWQNQDTYDFGHYQIMLNYLLSSNPQKWVDGINRLKGANVDTFLVSDFVVTSGFRHPHHNFEHAGSTASMSSHMYGYAMDVRGKALAGGKLLDINGDKRNTARDREIMTIAAESVHARYTDVYPSSKHVHADWAPSDWKDRQKTGDTRYTVSVGETLDADTTVVDIQPKQVTLQIAGRKTTLRLAPQPFLNAKTRRFQRHR